VSPFLSLFSPQPRVFVHPSAFCRPFPPQRVCSPRRAFVFITLRIPFPPARRSGPLFSNTYESLFPQLLSFHILPKPLGVWGAPLRNIPTFQPARANSFGCHTSKIVSCKSFPCHTYRKQGGGGSIMVNEFRHRQRSMTTRAILVVLSALLLSSASTLALSRNLQQSQAQHRSAAAELASFPSGALTLQGVVFKPPATRPPSLQRNGRNGSLAQATPSSQRRAPVLVLHPASHGR
jgi:hypothetical protein